MEIWKECHLSDKYSISNLGRVRNNHTNYIYKLYKGNTGYYTVNLKLNPKNKNCSVHRLVMLAFKNAECFEKATVNHIDGNKLNNNVNNLEWCTQQENCIHAYNIGLSNNIGENNTTSKLTDKQVLEIRKIYNENIMTQKELSKKYNVSIKNIYFIVNNKLWTHLPWEPKSKPQKIIQVKISNPNYRFKLTKEDIPKIKQLYDELQNYTKVGKFFNVSDNTIKKIIRDKHGIIYK